MWFILLIFLLIAPAVLFFLARAGRRLRQAAALATPQCVHWPSVGLVVPCAGTHPDMERALRSLLEQSYQGELKYALVTATTDEPAAVLVDRLSAEYPNVTHVVAGKAEGCGQKNHNSLTAVAELGDTVDIYAFCDSTHLASPDFLNRLVYPIASGHGYFSTGYHEVVPRDKELVTLAYAFCVLAMRILQGMSKFTQPWGGAMAIERETFHAQGIGRFWSDNVVDDCSLTTYLQQRGIQVHLCPGALLRTRAQHHSGEVWRAWFDRQILFLKFCVPSQWVGLGCLLLYMGLAPAMAFIAFLGGLVGLFSGKIFVAACVYLAVTAVALSCLRPLMPHHIPLIRWIGAFWLTCFTACSTYLKTVPAHGILWHGIWYNVGKAGKVESVVRKQ